MSCLVTDAEIVVREWHRQERIGRALHERATRRIEDGAAVPAYVLSEERRSHPAGAAAIRATAGQVEVESADPLGVWSCGYPRPPRCWPTWRSAADWAAWSVLCLLAIAYVAFR